MNNTDGGLCQPRLWLIRYGSHRLNSHVEFGKRFTSDALPDTSFCIYLGFGTGTIGHWLVPPYGYIGFSDKNVHVELLMFNPVDLGNVLRNLLHNCISSFITAIKGKWCGKIDSNRKRGFRSGLDASAMDILSFQIKAKGCDESCPASWKLWASTANLFSPNYVMMGNNCCLDFVHKLH